MARPTTIRQRKQTVQLGDPPFGQSYERLEYMTQPKGMFATIQPQQADKDTAIVAKNFDINETGKLQIRRPLKRVLHDATLTMMGIIGISSANGTGTLLLFHVDGIKWSTDGGTSWTAASGPALGAGSVYTINYAMWNTNTLLFTVSTASAKVYTYNTTTNVYSEVATSVAAQIMTVFGGRCVVSAGGTNSIYWSVKNDNTDFAGTGSGNEPVKLTPGLTVDDVIGLFPINDTQALVVRTGSVWMMELTGNVDTPFNFTFLYRVALASARTLAYSAEGIYALGLDDVLLLTTSGPESIGWPIIGGWIGSPDTVYNQYQAVGTYEALKEKYYVYIPYTSAANALTYLRGTDSQVATDQRVTDSGEDRVADWPLTDPTLVLCYHRKTKTWTYHSYSLNFHNFTAINFRTPAIKGLAVVTSDDQVFRTYRTDETLPNDGNEEYDSTNTLQPIEAQIVTGAIGDQSKSDDCTIGAIEVDLMTETSTATARRTYIRLYQTRSGPRTVPAGAVTYTDKASADSAGRILQKIVGVKTTKKFWQVDLQLSKCATYILQGLYVYVLRGSEINP